MAEHNFPINYESSVTEIISYVEKLEKIAKEEKNNEALYEILEVKSKLKQKGLKDEEKNEIVDELYGIIEDYDIFNSDQNEESGLQELEEDAFEFEIGDKVYSYQNENEPKPIEERTIGAKGYENKYKLSLDEGSSHWVNEHDLFREQPKEWKEEGKENNENEEIQDKEEELIEKYGKLEEISDILQDICSLKEKIGSVVYPIESNINEYARALEEGNESKMKFHLEIIKQKQNRMKERIESVYNTINKNIEELDEKIQEL